MKILQSEMEGLRNENYFMQSIRINIICFFTNPLSFWCRVGLRINIKKLTQQLLALAGKEKQQPMWNPNMNLLNQQCDWANCCQNHMFRPYLQQQNQFQYHQPEQNLQQLMPQKAQHIEASIKEQNSLPVDESANFKKQQNRFSSSSEDECSQGQSLKQGANNVKNKNRKKGIQKNTYKKYSRITPEIRQRLIHLIARQNMSIKDASVKLKINYSSAKFIFSQYRDKKLHIIDRELEKDLTLNAQICLKPINVNSKEIRGCNVDNVVVKCSSGGKFEAESSKIYSLKEISQLYKYSFVEKQQNEKVES